MRTLSVTSNKSLNMTGNGILEMLLFLPLALMLLFVGVDIGLSMLDQALVSDAVREAVHEQILEDGENLYVVRSSGPEVNMAAIEDISARMLERLDSVLGPQGRRLILASAEQDFASYRIEVRPVLLSINAETGVVESYSSLNSYVKNESFNLTSYAPKAQVKSVEEFLSEALPLGAGASSYSVVSPLASGNELYLTQSIAIHVKVEFVSASINPAWLESVIGGRSGYQVHEVHLVRT